MLMTDTHLENTDVSNAGKSSLISFFTGVGLLCAITCSAYANEGFGDGSFGEVEAQPNPAVIDPQTPVPADDGFGNGSFDDGGSFGGSEQPDTPDVGVIDDDFGGSFGESDFDQPDVPDHNQPRPKPDAGKVAEIPDDEKTIVENPVQIDPGILAFESRGFGVAPTNRLRSSGFHAPTPTSIPGGSFVSTAELASVMQAGHKIVLIDVLGGEYSLPNALMAPGMAQPGNYHDNVQRQTNQWLNQITGGNKQIPLVLYCTNPFCWSSYNASLRAIAAGYKNVYWYRGGIETWNMAGLRIVAATF